MIPSEKAFTDISLRAAVQTRQKEEKMNHEVLKQVIFDQRQIIRNTTVNHRNYILEAGANYIMVGVRRAGKSTMLYEHVQNKIKEGIGWDQIIYINFEDERLAEFTITDFNDIVQTASELSDQPPYYYLDEVQNIRGWERFARRMADAHEKIFITGSNAAMLSSEMEARLGGRFLSLEIMTYSFPEYLNAIGVKYDQEALYTSELNGKIRSAAGTYMKNGGFPESALFRDKRAYAENIYQKILLGDIAGRYAIRNTQALRILMKKVAETVGREITFSRLHNAVNATGVKCSKDSVITYISYAEEAFLLFHSKNIIAAFSERESTPRYYFYDNGLLNLFLIHKESLLLENAVALHLKRRYKNQIYYFKSDKTGIDIDFYIPEEKIAIQVTYTLNEMDMKRETNSLVLLSRDNNLKAEQYIIVTFEDDERKLDMENIQIRVVPLYKFLLE